MSGYLDRINEANDIKKIEPEAYDALASEIRSFIIESVSEHGGHLASNLGVVELTMALHLCMDFPNDKLIWDVGHQAYTHKLLTGRKEDFSGLRTFGGMSGFPKHKESPCDAFDTGHSSTSISAALGYARARDLKGEDRTVVAVIGDGSLTGGMAYEALNNVSHLKSNMIIVLNDNKMSISENVGGLSKHLTALRTRESYMDFKMDVEKKLKQIPHVGDSVARSVKKSKDSIRQLFVKGGFFEDFGIKYIGPIDGHDIKEMVRVLNALKRLNEPETSVALGFGFRCGFLGLLHLEIIQERLEREYNLDLVTTAPSVVYRIHKTNGEMIELTNPSNMPDPSEIEYMEEPIVSAEIMVTTDFIGPIMDLCQERRGVYLGMEYIETTRALMKYELPLNEIIYDFFDALKSRSRGYASFDYELKGYERSELCKLDILVNRENVDALSFIVFEGSAYERGRKMCEKLKEEIPRQLFEIPIQAAIGSKIIARETVRAMRKDVLAKCYGGDISRKRKLLEKQKEGKKRMRQVGNVEIPQKAFMSVLKLDEK